MWWNRIMRSFFIGGGFEIVFFLVFFAVLAIIITAIVKSISQWNKNNHSPRLTVDATVVTKRTQVSGRHNTNNMTHTATSYYVTFQVQSGDRMELPVSASEYAMLVENDFGKLTFQGTRYLGFERQ